MPICRVEPSSTRSAISSPIRASIGDSAEGLCSSSGRSVAMKAWIRLNGTRFMPCVRGIWTLISAMTTRAVSAAAFRAAQLAS